MVDKYTFRREFTDVYGQTKTVEHTIQCDTLNEILEDFLYFLNGCSFSYVKDLIFVKEDGQEVSVMDWDSDIYNNIDTVEDLQSELDFLEAKTDGC
jgi:uncharacterized protein YcsI (UPF0317 family)